MRLQCRKGQSLVEFVLILPLLLIFLFGVIEFGLVFYNKAVITNASREGARAAIVSVSSRTLASVRNQAETVALNYLRNNLVTFSNSTPAVIANPNPGAIAPFTINDELTVTVTYDYGWLALPGFLPGVPNPIAMQSRTVMRFE